MTEYGDPRLKHQLGLQQKIAHSLGGAAKREGPADARQQATTKPCQYSLAVHTDANIDGIIAVTRTASILFSLIECKNVCTMMMHWRQSFRKTNQIGYMAFVGHRV